MIYDRVQNIKQYKGVSANLDKAIEFLYATDFKTLNDGRNAVDGDRVFANIMSYETKDIEDAVKESHERYIDIHVMVSGKEQVLVSDISDLDIVEKYTNENDCTFYSGEMITSCRIQDD